jgi:hypothetical protein
MDVTMEHPPAGMPPDLPLRRSGCQSVTAGESWAPSVLRRRNFFISEFVRDVLEREPGNFHRGWKGKESQPH